MDMLFLSYVFSDIEFVAWALSICMFFTCFHRMFILRKRLRRYRMIRRFAICFSIWLALIIARFFMGTDYQTSAWRYLLPLIGANIALIFACSRIPSDFFSDEEF